MAFKYPYGDSQQLNLEWFLNKFKDLNDHYDDVAADLSAAQTAATTAVAAKNQAVISQTSAASSAGTAMTNALRAEGYAVGEQAGTPVGSGSPYYQDNAKYFATQAATSATNAGTSETNAGNSATAAGNAKTAAETAALEAEGFAVGEQNGTPVSSGSPYYQDNSKYYATQAGNSATAASTSETNAHNSELAAAASAASSDGAAAQAMIAPLESSTTAAAAHSIGEYFRLNGVLYIATADIEIGDTITVGTNCEQAVLGEDVSELKSTLIADRMAVPDAFQKRGDTEYAYGRIFRFINNTFKLIGGGNSSTYRATPISGKGTPRIITGNPVESIISALIDDDFIKIPLQTAGTYFVIISMTDGFSGSTNVSGSGEFIFVTKDAGNTSTSQTVRTYNNPCGINISTTLPEALTNGNLAIVYRSFKVAATTQITFQVEFKSILPSLFS